MYDHPRKADVSRTSQGAKSLTRRYAAHVAAGTYFAMTFLLSAVGVLAILKGAA
jgi:hypothetical protein